MLLELYELTGAYSRATYYGDELEAIRKFAEAYPDSTVRDVDSYDMLRSGVPNTIRVAHEVLELDGYRFRDIRLDLGDLACLSKLFQHAQCHVIYSDSLQSTGT